MELSKYIKELLFFYDCVIIPDFGGLVANYHSAEINITQNSFKPPKKDILFNKNLIYNDGLLINHIASTEKISYSEAKNITSEYVQNITDKLENGEKIIFEELGTFYFDKAQNLLFEPDLSINYLIDSFGLSSFQFPAINNDFNTKIKTQFKNKEAVNKFITNKTTKRVLISIPVIAALSLIPLNSYFLKNPAINFSSFNPTNRVAQETIATKTPQQKIEISNVLDETTNKRNALFYGNISETKNDTKLKKNKKYFLIVGSFKNLLNAKNLQQQLVNEGFNPEILNNNSQYRVSIENFDNKNTALKKLSKLRNQDNKSVWLLTK
ncbi:MAG: SPOR domain-containing protein [Bacteroidales bacterium]|nr:SPOR domain-containing protein [Bacteroidales bacterium]